jgi:hypothetical protein
VPGPFLILCSYTHFRRYRELRDPFSCFALMISFSMVPRAASPFFMFCAPEPVLGSTEGAGSSFNVLRLGTHFRMYMGRRVRFACFTVPDPFAVVQRASGPVCMFYTPGPVFIFCATGLIFGSNESGPVFMF